MPSNAYTNHLLELLRDADEIDQAHTRLRTRRRGRQWGLGGLNRAAVIACVSAWEAYIEAILVESLNALRPTGGPAGVWSALNANARGLIGRFNNPNVQKTAELFNDAIGLADVTMGWSWRNRSRTQARSRLDEIVRLRHQVAHGVNPRPLVHNTEVRRMPGFFRRLGSCTDRVVRAHLVNTLHILNPWP
ncbi:MAG: hypothetical protein GXY83_35960 [Rhodopirellula sp.]|nr:hypothetical protein [Rhodopirellula sp.]